MSDYLSKILRKSFISLVILVVMAGLGITIVLGNGGSSGDPEEGDGEGSSCKQCSCAYQPGSYAYGVRISLVDWKTGARISGTKSIDVFESNTLRGLAADKPATYTLVGDNANKFNRVDMILGGKMTSTNPKLEKTGWSKIDKVFASDLNWTSDKITFNYNDTSQSFSYSKMNEDLYNVLQKEVDDYAASGYKDKNELKITVALFSALGVDFTKYTKEDLNEMHLIVEPLVAVAVKGVSNMEANYNLFYGTITEIGAAWPQDNCSSENSSAWSMSASLVNMFGIKIYGTQPCNTKGDTKYCILNGWKVGDPSESGYYTRLNLLKEKNSNAMGLLWLGALNMPPAEDCTTVVEYINNLYTSKKITQSQYDNYILQVKNGNFEYTDPETEQVLKIETPQEFEFLVKVNYDKYNEGLAACANREKTSKNCEEAIEYINQNYIKNTQAYHDAVDKVEDGTFSYELYDGTIVKIDKAYSYNMLDKNVYTRYGGTAMCIDNQPPSCVSEEGSNVDIDNCETGKTFFGDIDNERAWLECEIAYTVGSNKYSSDNTGHEAVETTNGGIVGNSDYCEVFCYEEFETLFPTHVYDVKAGQTFKWGTSSSTFGSIKVRKKCSNQNYVKGQQGYRFEEWEEDYKNNEETMIRHYMKKAAYEIQKNNIKTDSDWIYTSCYKCHDTCKHDDGSTYACDCYNTCDKKYAGDAWATSGTSKDYNHFYVGGVAGNVTLQSYSTGYSYETAAEAETAAKDGLKSKLDRLAGEEANLYSQKKNQEAELIEKIEQCTNNIKYVHKATIQFTFKEPVNSVYGANSRSFEFNDNLIVDGNFNESNVDTSKCVEKTVYKYSCSGTGTAANCTATAKKVLNCSIVTWDISGNYEYKYPEEYFQWYTLKIDSTLVNEKEKGSEDEAFFYTVGFGLPTALSLTDGTYELKTVVYDLGDKANFSGGNPLYERPEDTHFDPLGLSVNTNLGTKKGFEYICTYEIDNEIFGYDCQYDESGKLIYSSPKYCDPTKDDDSDGSLLGIDITYRLVTLLSDGDSLIKAFPGKDGTGRDKGINWQLDEELLREILDADVYNDPAMYEIMLDVNAIQTIRKDNQTYFNAGKDPYASYYDANNAQKVYCATKGNEKYCASDFISDLYNGSGLNYRLLGTCLPTGNTLDRAKHVLDKGCDATYTYPTINWTR